MVPMAGGGERKLHATVLVVEDDSALRFALCGGLVARGFTVLEADSRASATVAFARRPDVVVSDFRLPDGDAIELMAAFKAVDPSVAFLIVTGFGTIDLAVRAVKLGAEDFLTKPVDTDTLGELVVRAADRRRTQRSGVRRRLADVAFQPRSDAMRRVDEQVERLRDATCSVLLLGETGTGKSVLARRIHSIGVRKSGPFVDVNCPGLGKDLVESELFGHERGAFTGAHAAKAGLFDAADGGTLFLDEIGDIDLHVQPKLLKVLEERTFRRMGDVRERTVDVRLLAATHQDLMLAVGSGTFRGDLYYRISTVTVNVPPLRERVEDIVPLAHFILRTLGEADVDFDPGATQALLAHAWPGNLRELKNVIERATLAKKDPVIRVEDLSFDRPCLPPPAAPASFPEPGRTLSEVEREQIEIALEAEGGRVEAAARRLGVPRSTLYQRIREMGIRPSRPRIAIPKPGDTGTR